MKDTKKSLNSDIPLIQVENLSFEYPIKNDHPVLDNVSFSINRGEFVGIMGPSGAGKTTLCMVLKGLIPYSVAGKLTGKVIINGEELNKDNLDDIEKKVGFVFQDPESQIIGLTIEEDLAFGPENHEWEREKIRKQIPKMLKIVRLDGMELRETWGLSGGQKQRVAIASALILEPDILILDEPTSELDPIGKTEVFETIERLKNDHKITIIVVEHEIEQMAEISDRIILLNEGKLIDQGKPKDLFRKIGLFNEIGGERVPQVSEVLAELQEKNYIGADQFAVTEEEGIKIIQNALESKQ